MLLGFLFMKLYGKQWIISLKRYLVFLRLTYIKLNCIVYAYRDKLIIYVGMLPTHLRKSDVKEKS